jgi:nucleoid-associated protein YgaU
MTERGLPIVDGAPACPFVAFEDDRDARAASPDHRHRCYAEVRPAPRALAHQEAYCLSSAFPVCPTFQDWARREAAQARRDAGGAPGAPPPEPPEGDSLRNPPRPWSAPPPWAGEPGHRNTEPAGRASGGLSGSMADRLAAGEPIREAEDAEAVAAGAGAGALGFELADDGPPPPGPRDTPPRDVAARAAGPRPDDGHGSARPESAPPAEPSRRRPPPMPLDPDAPSWERPRRMEAYPTLRARVGLPSISLPPLLLGVVAVGLAAAALFMLPGLLGLGGSGPNTSTTPGPSSVASAAPSASAEPTSTPAPTPQVYVVQSGDTLSAIATRFGVTLEALRAANPQITNVDEINIGDEITIPTTIPTQIPDAGSPSPSA